MTDQEQAYAEWEYQQNKDLEQGQAYLEAAGARDQAERAERGGWELTDREILNVLNEIRPEHIILARAAQAKLMGWLMEHSAVENLPLRDGGVGLRTIAEDVVQGLCQELGVENNDA